MSSSGMPSAYWKNQILDDLERIQEQIGKETSSLQDARKILEYSSTKEGFMFYFRIYCVGLHNYTFLDYADACPIMRRPGETTIIRCGDETILIHSDRRAAIGIYQRLKLRQISRRLWGVADLTHHEGDPQ